MVTAPPVLPADLNDGLKRLKMAAMRRLGPELLVTAKTQRWSPEEFLRTLVEAEIAARDASNAATRRRQAGFPIIKTLDEYDRSVSSVPGATLDYLASLEWVRAAENVCLIGPAGTGKSHLLLALGSAAVDAGHKVRYLTAADLVDALYRGLADNSVGRVIDTLLRNDVIMIDELGFAPLDDTAAQLLFRFVAAATLSAPTRAARSGGHAPTQLNRIPIADRSGTGGTQDGFGMGGGRVRFLSPGMTDMAPYVSTVALSSRERSMGSRGCQTRRAESGAPAWTWVPTGSTATPDDEESNHQHRLL